MSRTATTCVIYARISKSDDASVSVDRQLVSGREHAAAKGLRVVGEFVDDGVSATKNRPDQRQGWRALLETPTRYDVVLVWKSDRLARRVVDFHNAAEALNKRGAGLAAVDGSIDLTTAQGRAFATIGATFAELEAATTSERVTAARDHMLRRGRYVGGRLPYGYMRVPHPAGAGYVIVKDPERIGYVEQMVQRTMQGRTIYSTMQYLNEIGAPTPTWRAPMVWQEWKYNSVNRILRHPLLAGLVPHNPGRKHPLRGEGVVRDDNGLRQVHERLAVMTVQEWEAMQAKLAEPSPRRAPRALRRVHSGALSGLMWCGDPRHDEPVRMHRGTVGSATGPRPAYTCPAKGCHQTISMVEDLIVAAFLDRCGTEQRLRVVEEVVDGYSAVVAETTVRLAELGREQADPTISEARYDEIDAERRRLRRMQQEAMAQPSEVRYVVQGSHRTYAQDWAAATTDEERSAIIGQAIERIVVRRGKQGGWTDAAKMARCEFEWRPSGQWERPDDATLEAWAAADLA